MSRLKIIFILLLISFNGICQSVSYGLWYNSSNSTHHLASIDMHTGQMTVIDTSNNVGIVSAETAVINPTTNQYIFRGRYPSSNTERYFAIDINTGAMVNDTLAPDGIRMLKIHPTTNSVYGLWYNSSNSTHHLASIDMLTGQMTVIDTSNNVGIVSAETAVINPTTNQYIFRGRYPSSNTERYFAIDINTGAMVNDTLALDGIRMLKYHSPSGNSVVENNPEVSLIIYPNPFNQFAFVEFENSENRNFTFKLFDTQGKLIQYSSGGNTNQVVIEGNNLKSGFYFFHLQFDEQKMIVGKLIKE